jgi:hypothetical protein
MGSNLAVKHSSEMDYEGDEDSVLRRAEGNRAIAATFAVVGNGNPSGRIPRCRQLRNPGLTSSAQSPATALVRSS